jgi:tRNA pseudouridine55 synthase
LSKKKSYRLKYLNQLADGEPLPPRAEKKPFVALDENIKQPYLDGKVILIDKPLHWTSFDVIRKMRGLLQIKKIGHAGTLDPLATGLLIVCTGKFTKKINEFMAQRKEYTGTFILGATTPTYDLESEPTNFKNFEQISNNELIAVAKNFEGAIQQVPPIFSAIKKDGVALYELARRGEEVTLLPRPIHIYTFEIIEINLPVVHFKVLCSTGTYIRSLAHDYGVALGCGAYLGSLHRTSIGEYLVNDAVDLNKFETDLHS